MSKNILSDKHTFQYSHLFGTIIWGDGLNMRAPWVKIDENVYLGSMLFENGEWLYKNHTLNAFIKSEKLAPQKTINIVQVVEAHEIKEKANPSLLVGVKDKSHALQSREGINIIGPIEWADFKYEANSDKNNLADILSSLYEKNQKDELIYFHCKAGVNRSLRMAALFSVYQKIKKSRERSSTNKKINPLQIDDFIMQSCSDIWDKRPCVCFDRGEWLQQYQNLKTSIHQICKDDIETGVQIDDDYHFENNIRLNLQYELYRYRHHLQQTQGQYAEDKTKQKINSVQGLIDVSKYHNDSAANNRINLRKIRETFTYELTNGNSKKTLKDARSEGLSWLIQTILNYIFFRTTKGCRVLSKCNRMKNKITTLPKARDGLFDFFGGKAKAQSTPGSLPEAAIACK